MDVLVLVVLVVMQISLEFVCVSKIRQQLGISPLRRQRVTDFPQLIVCLIPWLWKLCHNSVPNPSKSISWSNDRLFTVPYFFVRSFRYTASYRKMVARDTKRSTSTILQRQYSLLITVSLTSKKICSPITSYVAQGTWVMSWLWALWNWVFKHFPWNFYLFPVNIVAENLGYY